MILLLGLFRIAALADASGLNRQAGVVSVADTYLNVRSSASTSGKKVASLGKGSYVTLVSKSGSWWQVEYAKGKYGYCHADYIRPVSSSTATVKTQSGALNVRSGAGTNYRKTGSLARGETVVVLSTSGNWSRILYHGTKTGYVSTQYLSIGNPAISLQVPNLKQADSRWGNLELGESGKTFAQIGCATTAIAMMESHRTGRTIYPDEMAKSLRYTPSGNVFWPGHYSVVTSNEDYLKKIYAFLKQGKPVLFGAINAGGSQHWVVIHGFTGGTLTEANFTIRDPGTYSRTNLKQFLQAYPNFYKYFFY